MSRTDDAPTPDAFQEGVDAWRHGQPRTACPYPSDTEFGGHSDYSPASEWLRGWNQAQEDNVPREAGHHSHAE